MEDVDHVAVVEDFVVAKNFDNGNSNAEVGVEFGCESSKVVSIRYVDGGCCNSTIEESSCVMDS